MEMKIGVVQGSVLGSVLYFLYTNDKNIIKNGTKTQTVL